MPHVLLINEPRGQRATRTEAEGPGVRFAVWVQGCPMRCPGCCNPQFLPLNSGNPGK